VSVNPAGADKGSARSKRTIRHPRGGLLQVSQAAETTGYYYTRGRNQRAASP